MKNALMSYGIAVVFMYSLLYNESYCFHPGWYKLTNYTFADRIMRRN
jgi:hypothetical protein